MTGLAVPFPRPLHEGDHGLDVVATKRALSRAGYITWPEPGKGFTPYYGPFMTEAVDAFAKKVAGIGKGHGYTEVLHKALEATHAHGHPKEWAFDARAISLEKQEIDLLTPPDTRVRAAILAAGFFWYAHRMAFGYSETRPFAMLKPPQVPSRWDCSAYVTNCYYAGGALNPNGIGDGTPRGWDGLGYTGTLMGRGTRVSIDQLKPTDLVFFGFYNGPPSPAFPPGSPTHVAMFTGWVGHVPMLLSNGSYPMGYVPLTYRGDVNHCRTYPVV